MVLASASPRRADLLRMLGLSFTVTPAEIVESPLPGESPTEMVRRLAVEKAAAVRDAGEGALAGAIVVGGDTVVVLEGEVLGKPADERDAVRMLTALSGRSHQVASGLALALPGGGSVSGVSETEVAFRCFSAAEAEAYVRTGEPMDKAGAYGIQGLGASLVRSVRGDYYTVVGFPIPLFLELLGEGGFEYTFGAEEGASLRRVTGP